MLCLCAGLIALQATLPACEYGGEPMFFVWVSAIFFTFTGNFTLMPAVMAKAFGKKHLAVNLGLLFTSLVGNNFHDHFINVLSLEQTMTLILLIQSGLIFFQNSISQQCKMHTTPYSCLPTLFTSVTRRQLFSFPFHFRLIQLKEHQHMLP